MDEVTSLNIGPRKLMCEIFTKSKMVEATQLSCARVKSRNSSSVLAKTYAL